MTGLILKDFLLVKKTLIYLIVVILFFGGIYSAVDNSYFMSFFISIMMISVVISTMSYDEFYHWDRYVATLPLTRRQIVGAKYLSAMLFFAAGAGASLMVGLTVPTLHGSFLTLEDACVIALAPMMGLVGVAVVIPCYYRFGAQQSRMVMLVLYGIPSLILVVVMRFAPQLLEGVMVIWPGMAQLLVGVVGVTAVVMVLSFYLSVRILEGKELK